MIPELSDQNVTKLAMAFLDANVLLPHPITVTTFIGYAFPTDEHHPEPWGKRAGHLRNRINKWITDREDQIREIMSKRGKPTHTWKDNLKIAALKAKAPRNLVDARATKEWVKGFTAMRLEQ